MLVQTQHFLALQEFLSRGTKYPHTGGAGDAAFILLLWESTILSGCKETVGVLQAVGCEGTGSLAGGAPAPEVCPAPEKGRGRSPLARCC